MEKHNGIFQPMRRLDSKKCDALLRLLEEVTKDNPVIGATIEVKHRWTLNHLKPGVRMGWRPMKDLHDDLVDFLGKWRAANIALNRVMT